MAGRGLPAGLEAWTAAAGGLEWLGCAADGLKGREEASRRPGGAGGSFPTAWRGGRSLPGGLERAGEVLEEG